MICRICGKEKETRREMHGHFMRCHYDDYKRADFRLERVCTDCAALKKQPVSKKNYPIPEGFRLLRRTDPDEANAISQGFDFIDSEQNIYTEAEARAEQWI